MTLPQSQVAGGHGGGALVRLSCFSLFFFATSSLAADIYVSPSGTGSGSSTDDPLGSIQSAVDLAVAGDTIHLLPGTYAPEANIQITETSGTSSAPIELRSYSSDDWAVLDGENMPGTPYGLDESLPNDERGILHIENVDYWKFTNLELINGPYGIYARDASHNSYSHLSTHDNYESGFQVQGESSHNTVEYLDSYRNRDPRKNGESADGIAVKEGSGEGNSLRSIRLWDNVDDGLDFYMFSDSISVVDVYAWANGFNRWGFDDFQGDGNGFKLGITDNPPANHVVENCMAFGNAAKGFIDNGNPGSLTFTRNTAWNNGDTGFVMRSSSSVMQGNIAAENAGGDDQVSLIDAVESLGNSWDDGETWGNSSFISVDPSVLKGDRDEDGEIVGSDFLLPVNGEEIGATTQE